MSLVGYKVAVLLSSLIPLLSIDDKKVIFPVISCEVGDICPRPISIASSGNLLGLVARVCYVY